MHAFEKKGKKGEKRINPLYAFRPTAQLQAKCPTCSNTPLLITHTPSQNFSMQSCLSYTISFAYSAVTLVYPRISFHQLYIINQSLTRFNFSQPNQFTLKHSSPFYSHLLFSCVHTISLCFYLLFYLSFTKTNQLLFFHFCERVVIRISMYFLGILYYICVPFSSESFENAIHKFVTSRLYFCHSFFFFLHPLSTLFSLSKTTLSGYYIVATNPLRYS